MHEPLIKRTPSSLTHTHAKSRMNPWSNTHPALSLTHIHTLGHAWTPVYMHTLLTSDSSVAVDGQLGAADSSNLDEQCSDVFTQRWEGSTHQHQWRHSLYEHLTASTALVGWWWEKTNSCSWTPYKLIVACLCQNRPAARTTHYVNKKIRRKKTTAPK